MSSCELVVDEQHREGLEEVHVSHLAVFVSRHCRPGEPSSRAAESAASSATCSRSCPRRGRAGPSGWSIFQLGFLIFSMMNGGTEQMTIAADHRADIDRRRPVADAGRRDEPDDEREHASRRCPCRRRSRCRPCRRGSCRRVGVGLGVAQPDRRGEDHDVHHHEDLGGQRGQHPVARVDARDEQEQQREERASVPWKTRIATGTWRLLT